MRKFLVAAAVVALAACGEKKAEMPSGEAMGAAAGAAVDTMAHEADSAMGAMADSTQSMAHEATESGKSGLQKAADKVDSVLKNTEADTAASRMDAKKN